MNLQRPARIDMAFYIGIFLGMVIAVFSTLFEPSSIKSIPVILGIADFVYIMLLIIWIFGE